MQILRIKSLMTVITMIVMLQIMNVSIDPVDGHTGQEDLSVNEIESYVEFVVEILLDEFNAIEESDDQDESSCKPHASHVTLFSSDCRITIQAPTSSTNFFSHFAHWESLFQSLPLSILSPPPRVA